MSGAAALGKGARIVQQVQTQAEWAAQSRGVAQWRNNLPCAVQLEQQLVLKELRRHQGLKQVQ